MAKQPRQLEPGEYEKIMSLPKRTFRIGGETRVGRFDEESRKFYELNEQGELTGKVVMVATPANKPPVTEAKAEEGALQNDEENENEEEDSESKGFFAKFKVPLIIAGGLLAFIVIIFVFMSAFSGTEPGPDPSQTEGPAPTEPAVTEVHVMKVNQDLLPGHVLTPEDVSEVVLDKADYDEVALFGRNLYTWTDLDKLVGNYLSKFVPANQYLEQNDVQAAAPFDINPWAASEPGTTLLKVPVDPTLTDNLNFGFGSVVSLTVRKVTSSQIAVGDEPIDVPGLTHTTTVGTTSRTEEFTVGGLHVCDLLNSSGQSVYNAYCAYIGVPLGNRLDYLCKTLSEDENLWEALTPTYAMIRVTEQQAAAIGDVFADNVTAIVQTDGTSFIATNEQAKFASEASAVKTTLYQAKAYNEEKQAQERAELEKAVQDAKAKENQED